MIKLERITVSIVARNDSAPNTGASNQSALTVESVIDSTDGTIHASADVLYQYGNYQLSTANAGTVMKRSFKPMYRQQIFTPATSFIPGNDYFASDGGLPSYYGMKFNMYANATGNSVIFKVDFKYTCKKLK